MATRTPQAFGDAFKSDVLRNRLRDLAAHAALLTAATGRPHVVVTVATPSATMAGDDVSGRACDAAEAAAMLRRHAGQLPNAVHAATRILTAAPTGRVWAVAVTTAKVLVGALEAGPQ